MAVADRGRGTPACRPGVDRLLNSLGFQVFLVRAAEIRDHAAGLQLDDAGREPVDELAVV